MAITKLGKVTTVPKGDYVSTAKYERLDIVLFDGSTYMCRKTVSGIEPQEGVVTEYWMPYGQSINVAETGRSGIVRPDGRSIVIKDPVTGQLGVGEAHSLPVEGESLDGNTVGDVLESLDARLDNLQDTISDEWDEERTYYVGDYCISNNKLYKCKVQNEGQEPVQGDYWEFVSVSGELNEINGNLEQIEKIHCNVEDILHTPTWDGETHYYGATEDCIFAGRLDQPSSSVSGLINLGRTAVTVAYANGVSVGVYIPIKKGQNVAYRGARTSTAAIYKVY